MLNEELNGASVPDHFGDRTFGGDGVIRNLFNLDPVFGDPKYNRPACNDGKFTFIHFLYNDLSGRHRGRQCDAKVPARWWLSLLLL